MIKRVPFDLVKWYVIKDLIFNNNIIKALEIAKNCKHPDAIWFFNLCKDLQNINDFLKVLEPLKDAKSLFFRGFLEGKEGCIIQSANIGYVHAIYHVIYDFNLKAIEECALKGERDACYILGGKYKKDEYKNIIYAASLGHYIATNKLFSRNYIIYPEVRYIIGRAFSVFCDNDLSLFYLSQNESCRKAVDTWSLISTRLRIYKDLRILIAKMIWETRFEALY